MSEPETQEVELTLSGDATVHLVRLVNRHNQAIGEASEGREERWADFHGGLERCERRLLMHLVEGKELVFGKDCLELADLPESLKANAGGEDRVGLTPEIQANFEACLSKIEGRG